MAFELDPFDDVFADRAPKNPRAGGKFQPKFKPQPRKESSKSAQPIQQPVNNGSDNQPIPPPVSSLLTSETDSITSKCSGVDPSSESGAAAPRECVDPIGKSGSENSDLCFEFSQSANANVKSPTRSPTKVHMAAELKNKLPTSSSVTNDDEASIQLSGRTTVPVSDTGNGKEGLGFAVVKPVDNSTSDPLTGIDATVSTSIGDVQANNSTIGTEEVEAFHSWDELITSSGQKAGKFQPKPKLRMENENACSPIVDLNIPTPVTSQLDAQSVPSGAEYMEHGTIPAFSCDEVPDLSMPEFHDSTPADGASELPVQEEPTKVANTLLSDAAAHEELLEAVSPVPGKNVSQRSKSGKRKKTIMADLPMEQKKGPTSGQENLTARSSRQLRKRINEHEPTIEYEDEVHANEDLSEEHPGDLVGNEEDQNDIDYQAEMNLPNERGPRKSNKPVAEKEKPAPKRRKGKDVSDQSNKEPRKKKFSHSTRRNKRKVDKALLETPEHLIDPQKLRIRDLILLAEHHERMSRKETASGTPLTNQSGGNSSAHFNEDNTYASELGGGSEDEQMSPKVQESSSYFNYQTYMDKTPTSRWSKQDTELFYEAVRQFGTDLSLIQQLFPDRTRKQVKLKFKKEERQHPLRFQEALTTRTTDFTHFEKVFQRLQEISGQEKQNSNKDDSVDHTDEGVELAPETNEKEVEKSEQQQIEEEDEGIEEAGLLPKVQSPIKSDDSEDDSYRWSQYKSEF